MLLHVGTDCGREEEEIGEEKEERWNKVKLYYI
jgi:hypothetical protein